METLITKPQIEEKILEDLQSKVDEEKQVIVHCCFPASPFWGNLIRIWKSTFVIVASTDHKSDLVHAENFSIYPYWTEVQPMKDYWFTLVFTGLPKDCTNFNLVEEIPQEGGFFISNIKRNSKDVYRVKIS